MHLKQHIKKPSVLQIKPTQIDRYTSSDHIHNKSFCNYTYFIYQKLLVLQLHASNEKKNFVYHQSRSQVSIASVKDAHCKYICFTNINHASFWEIYNANVFIDILSKLLPRYDLFVSSTCTCILVEA